MRWWLMIRIRINHKILISFICSNIFVFFVIYESMLAIWWNNFVAIRVKITQKLMKLLTIIHSVVCNRWNYFSNRQFNGVQFPANEKERKRAKERERKKKKKEKKRKNKKEEKGELLHCRKIVGKLYEVNDLSLQVVLSIRWRSI